MQNPNGPYPGRQLFLGLTSEKKPCLAYLVTGRSAASRERMAVEIENGIRIGPVGSAEYDPLRHYTAMKYENSSGIVAVSNGIQTEAIFEAYRLIYNTGNQPGKEYLEMLLEGAGAEPDPPINTARIAGVITTNGADNPVFIIGIKVYGQPARAWQINAEPGLITGVAVYAGNMEQPEAPDTSSEPSALEFSGTGPGELGKFLFDISAATHKGGDIRVCTVGGVRTGKKWDTAIKNVLTA